MFSLSALCIKSICQNVSSAADFLVESPLPWTLTYKILRKYSNCKWQYINEIAYSSADKYDDNYYYDVHGDEDGVKCSRTVLEFLLMYNDVYDDDDDVRVIPFNCMNVLLASSDWESIFEHKYKYCVWVNSYRIVSLNITICKSCHYKLKNFINFSGK
ncbi:hypothetical protein ABEB36_013997 [Hypothenemus hampei]|uniref:Uncharacterized protein n=1 Tax=Hypothenemus hampei TaxID=57062 RepID=A0ABD1E2Z7_HYPHA